jgi:hypothetical protein
VHVDRSRVGVAVELELGVLHLAKIDGDIGEGSRVTSLLVLIAPDSKLELLVMVFLLMVPT